MGMGRAGWESGYLFEQPLARSRIVRVHSEAVYVHVHDVEIEIEIGIEIGIDSCSDWHLALMERSNFAAKLQQAPLTSILFPRP